METLSAEIVARWRAGDQQAAGALFRRYAERLLALARSRLSSRLARHIDPEDVVQSAYRSFFSGARAGRYVLKRSGDLWRLLVAITLHKLHHQVERHTAGKRSIARECQITGEAALIRLSADALADEPTPSEAVALAETLEQVFRGMQPRERRIAELRLQGHSLDEIAADVQRSERTVRRVLDLVKKRLKQECLGDWRP